MAGLPGSGAETAPGRRPGPPGRQHDAGSPAQPAGEGAGNPSDARAGKTSPLSAPARTRWRGTAGGSWPGERRSERPFAERAPAVRGGEGAFEVIGRAGVEGHRVFLPREPRADQSAAPVRAGRSPPRATPRVGHQWLTSGHAAATAPPTTGPSHPPAGMVGRIVAGRVHRRRCHAARHPARATGAHHPPGHAHPWHSVGRTAGRHSPGHGAAGHSVGHPAGGAHAARHGLRGVWGAAH